VDGDYAPTSQQVQVFEELRSQAQPLLAKCRELMTKDLVALNDMINKQSIPALYVPSKKDGETVKAAGGTGQ
jgi:hypothetical protein